MNPIRIIPISNLITQETFECVQGARFWQAAIEKEKRKPGQRCSPSPLMSLRCSFIWSLENMTNLSFLPKTYSRHPSTHSLFYSLSGQVAIFCCWGKSICSCVSLQHLKSIELRKWPGIRLTFSKVFRTLASDWRSPIHRNWCLETRK